MAKPARFDMKIYPIIENDLAVLRECLLLDAETGVLFWKKKIAKKVVVGTIAGRLRSDGYLSVQVCKRRYLAHRIIYAMCHGSCIGEVDHINGNPTDNRPSNLRAVTRSQQNMNRAMQRNNTSGHKGVYWYKPKGYWVARIKVQKKYICLGYYKDIEKASAAYRSAAQMYHGDYRRAY